MRSLTVAIFLLSAFTLTSFGQECYEQAKEVAPTLSKETALKYSEALEKTAIANVSDPSVDNAIWYARRKGYLGKYKDAIEALTITIGKHPNDPRLYRHRGHRLITLRCFDDAIRDFEKAAKLVKGKPDEVEPDGLPNARNIPTSTLQSNIWYHLGLAYYLKGDLKRAARAYKECMKVSKNNDMLAATTHWYYMTLRRLGKHDEAKKLLDPFDSKFEVIENDDYLKLLRLYRGDLKADDLAKTLGDKSATLGSASLGYGIGNWYHYIGETEKSFAIFERVTAGDQWASFGYIAAEAELARKPRK
ncbi:MAG: tetratricopeptide repeat protein [Blastocatellia bacterium]|nr:tetratricopeptide repeat protein [Blastocatellia bacterium]